MTIMTYPAADGSFCPLGNLTIQEVRELPPALRARAAVELVWRVYLARRPK